MKKLAVTLAIIVSAMFLFSSCSKESGTNDKLIGEWEITHSIWEWDNNEAIDSDLGDIYKFYANGNCWWADEILLNYVVDNDTIILGNDYGRYSIEKLTSSKLIINKVSKSETDYYEFKRVR